MKRITPPDDSARFSGYLRHYHRYNTQTHCSWDEWVGGAAGKNRTSRHIRKILRVTLGTTALLGVITGVIVELR